MGAVSQFQEHVFYFSSETLARPQDVGFLLFGSVVLLREHREPWKESG